MGSLDQLVQQAKGQDPLICLRLPPLRDSKPPSCGWMTSNLFWLTEALMERLKPFSRRATASPGLMICAC